MFLSNNIDILNYGEMNERHHVWENTGQRNLLNVKNRLLKNTQQNPKSRFQLTSIARLDGLSKMRGIIWFLEYLKSHPLQNLISLIISVNIWSMNQEINVRRDRFVIRDRLNNESNEQRQPLSSFVDSPNSQEEHNSCWRRMLSRNRPQTASVLIFKLKKGE